MARSAILSVEILVDSAKGAKGLDKAAGKVGSFEKGLGKLAAPAAVAMGALAGIGKVAMDAASDLEQAMGGVDSVFGASAGKIKDWSDQAATSAGLSKTEYANLATVIGAQLANMGVPLDKAAEQTNTLVTLGADLAATFGGTTADAVGALSAAFRGEADPAERYGLSLSQTAINAELAAKGQDKLTGQALQTAKATAILELATKQAAGATGQFARESDSASGSAQIAKAQFSDAAAALGKALLPAASKVAGILSVMAGWLKDNARLAQILIGVVGGLAAGILVLNGAIKAYNAVTKIMAVISKAAWISALGPIGWVIAAIVAVVAVVVVLYNKFAWFRSFVDAVWRGIQAAALAVAKAVGAAWQAAAGVLTAVWHGITQGAANAWRAIETIVRNVVDAIVSIWQNIVGTVSGVWQAISGAVISALAPIRTAIQWIKDAWDNTVGAISNSIGKVKGWLDGIAGKIGGVLGKLNPFSKGAPPSSAAGVVTPSLRRAGVGSAAPAAAGGAAGGTVIYLTVNGAVDADGTARTIGRVLSGRARRVGPVQLGAVLA